MKKCPDIQLFVDGELSDVERFEIRAHLNTCEVCALEERRLTALIQRLGDLPKSMGEDRDLWPAIKDRFVTVDPMLLMLAEAIAVRDVATATSLVVDEIGRFADLDPTQTDAAEWLYAFVLWLDFGAATSGTMMGLSNLDLAKDILSRFPASRRARRPIREVALLRASAGLLAAYDGKHQRAFDEFKFVVDVRAELDDTELVAVANAEIAKSLNRLGRYGEAMQYADDAVALAQRADRPAMVAAFKLVKAWALVKQGTTRVTVPRAIRLLDEAESVIECTDDSVCLADIQSAKARIARRRGLPGQSLELYNRAVDNYARVDGQHRRLAHALLFRAPVKLYLARIFDTTGESPLEGDTAQLRTEAADDLRAAEEIYALLKSSRGRSMVLIGRSQLELDLGRLHQAGDSADEAYQIAKRSADRMIMARARIQQCRVAHAWAAGAVDRPRDRNQDLDSAFCFADEAVDLAEETQNAKLIAQSHIWRGLTFVRKRPARLDEAEADGRKADSKLDPAINDYVRDEITTLQFELETFGRMWRAARSKQRDRATSQTGDRIEGEPHGNAVGDGRISVAIVSSKARG